MILRALQGVGDSPREGSRKERTLPGQSQQPGPKRRGGGFTAAALQTAHLRRGINPVMVQHNTTLYDGKQYI